MKVPRFSLLPALLILTLAGRAAAADPPVDPTGSLKASVPEGALARATAPPPTDRMDRPLDVVHYDLSFTIDPRSPDLSGRVEAVCVTLEATDRILLDFESETSGNAGMSVLDATADGVAYGFTHVADTLAVQVGRMLAAGDTTRIVVDFDGRPLRGSNVGWGYRIGFYRDTDFRVDEDAPLASTLSEPVSARTWWPCHDHPFDAATVRLTVDLPDSLELAAPGVRESDVDLGTGWRRTTFFMPHPIPSYLVSLIVADLEVWTDEVELDELLPDGSTTRHMVPLEFYAPPTLADQARYSWQNTGLILQALEQWFGPYPFADVKYGNALFSGGIAMEHPTLTSFGDGFIYDQPASSYPGPIGDLVNMHEAAHQWFGDTVRLTRWGDIWLNEGFARYAEVLWLEEHYGESYAREHLDRIWSPLYDGTLRDPNPTTMFGITTYNKGAWTLHMLRQILGREGLLTAMREYVTDPALRYHAVTVEDFQAHCEAVYAQQGGDGDLSWFFDPWQDRPGRPSLTVNWEQKGGDLSIHVRQPSDRVYRLPLPIRVTYADGTAEDRVEWVGNGDGDDTVAFSAPAVVLQVLVDPDRNWLLDVSTPGVAALALRSVVPNPFNPLTRIMLTADRAMDLDVDVYDVRGRHLRTLHRGGVDPGIVVLDWDGSDDRGRTLASGVYVVRARGAGAEESRKVTLVR